MKRFLPFALALLLASCDTPTLGPNSSAAPVGSSSDSPISSDSPVSSSVTSESSAVPSSAPLSSESSVAPIAENKIFLYNANSHLFVNDANDRTNPFLKTYRHKDHEDVPYVDLDEFHHVRRLVDPSLCFHNLVSLGNGRYDLFSSYGAHCFFDVEKQTVEIADADVHCTEVSEGKTGLFADPCFGYKYLVGSDKTKHLASAEKTTYALNKYHMDIVEQDGHLYVPFSLASHLLVNTMYGALAYNGKDFYNSALIGQGANVIRAYSNDSGFLWAYQDTADTAAHFAKVAAKEGEAYRFEATLKDMRKQDMKCSAIFLANGTLTIKSEDLLETVDYNGTWKQDGQMLIAEFNPQGIGRKQTQYIDLSEGGYYHTTQRTASMAEATYYQLCMDFDYQYGLKDMLQISSFDAEFQRLGYKEALLGKDIDAYQDALSKFLVAGKMGDSHYTAISEGFSSIHPGVPVALRHKDDAGERIIRHQEGAAKVSQAKSSNDLKNITLNVQGETAMITFTSFVCDYKKEFKGIDYYKVPDGTENVDAFLTSKMTAHFVEGICYAMNEIKKNEAIKNVVFDVGYNTGGYTMFIPFVSAIMTDDPSIIVENSISGSRIEAHYRADLNADGVYGGAGDTWKGQYNYYILQAGGSFSAGNIFPTSAKNGGYAKTIGEPTAGGGCGVSRRCDITGFFFQYNGYLGFPERKEDGSFVNSEAGTTPMIAMDVNDAYNLTKLDNKLKEYKA